MERYLEILGDQLAAFNVYERVRDVWKKLDKYGPTLETLRHFNALDRDITRAMLHAEKRCFKGRTGKHPWSPALSLAGWVVRYWKTRLRLLLGGYTIPDFVKAMRERFSIEDEAAMEAEVLEGLRMAKTKLREVQGNVEALQKSHLEERAEKMAILNDVEKESAIWSIMNMEATQVVF